jgi:hypothetical protein
VPTAEEIAQLQHSIDGCTVEITVRPGERLSQLHDQDSYSFAIATIAVGADSEEELTRKYEQALAGLPFEFDAAAPDPVEPPVSGTQTMKA